MPPSDDLHKLSLRWTGILFSGVLLLLLVVLAITTMNRVEQTRELMTASLTHHGTLIVTSLEGAARAGMRHGLWRMHLLQALTEEMSAHRHVRAVMVLDGKGGVLAAAGKVDEDGQTDLTMDSLSPEIQGRIRHGLDVDRFNGHELLVGRPFDPWRHLREPGGGPPRIGRGPGMMGPGMMGPGPDMMGQGNRRWGRGPDRETLERFQKGYALVRLSTADFEQARSRDLQQAVLLAGLIFLAGAVAAAGLVAVARRRSREVEKLRREVSEVQHLAAVGRLAASVAHEVRNPLSAIRGMVQYLGKHCEPDSKQAEYAQVALSEVDRLARVVTSLLEYSRPRLPRRVEMDLGESLTRVKSLLADEPLAKSVEIELQPDPELPAVWADPDQVGQVLLNLSLNALQALNGEGRLRLGSSRDGDRVRLVVEDSGPGLPPGDPEQVFDPFFSTKEMGTGLGLAIARRLVQAHDGEITASRSELGGARFEVLLPVGGPGAEG